MNIVYAHHRISSHIEMSMRQVVLNGQHQIFQDALQRDLRNQSKRSGSDEFIGANEVQPEGIAGKDELRFKCAVGLGLLDYLPVEEKDPFYVVVSDLLKVR